MRCRTTSPGSTRASRWGKAAAKANARTHLALILTRLEQFQLAHPRLRGLFPWGPLDESGLRVEKQPRRGRDCVTLPAIDQGILAFALVAASWRLQGSGPPE